MNNPFANIQQFNPAQAGMQAFQQGMQMGQQFQGQNALSQYAANPNDPKAREGLIKYKPEMYMQLQQRQQQQQQQAIEARRKDFVIGAQIFRQVQPKDDASYQVALQAYQRAGGDMRDVPTTFDANFVQQTIAVADALKPEKEVQPSALIQGYQFRQGLPEAERPTFDRYQQNARPQIFGSGETGYNVYDPGGVGAPPPQQGQPQQITDKAQYDALQPGQQYVAPDGTVRTKGGQSGAAPTGGFLDPLAPRL